MKMFRKKIIILILLSVGLSFLFSCAFKSSVDDGYYFQNFDDLKVWVPGVRVTSERAFSGDYSIYTDSLNQFSQTFVMGFDYAKAKGYVKVSLSAWCLKPSRDASVGLVITLDAPDKTITSASSNLSAEIKQENAWQKVSLFLDLPKDAPGGSLIKVYLWTPVHQKAFADDVEIKFSK